MGHVLLGAGTHPALACIWFAPDAVTRRISSDEEIQSRLCVAQDLFVVQAMLKHTNIFGSVTSDLVTELTDLARQIQVAEMPEYLRIYLAGVSCQTGHHVSGGLVRPSDMHLASVVAQGPSLESFAAVINGVIPAGITAEWVPVADWRRHVLRLSAVRAERSSAVGGARHRATMLDWD